MQWIRRHWEIILLALFNSAIHLWVIPNFEYHRDELLYFSQGMHPAFGYVSVPPLTAWIAFVMQSVFGYSLFAVKLFPALLGGAMVVLAAQIAKELGGNRYSQLLTAVGILVMPTFMRSFHLFQPVSIDFFLWTLLFYLVVRFVNTKNEKLLIWFGFFSGLALLNKYLVLFLLLALLISLVFSPYRFVFKSKKFYVGIILSILLFAPNLIWQYVNNWPIIEHMQVLHDQQLIYVSRWTFLGDQLYMAFAAAFLIVLGLARLLLKRKYRFMGLTILLVLGFLLVFRGKSYYTLGIFPIVLASGSVYLSEFIKAKWVRITIPITMVLITIPILPYGLPVYKEVQMIAYFKKLETKYGITTGRTFEDGSLHTLPQDYADQLGWEELASVTNTAYQSIPEKDKALIYCENYGQASAIAVIGKKYNLPEPVCFNESFLYWAPKEFTPDIEYFIYINDELGDDVAAAFGKITVVGQITNRNAREYGTTVYLCEQPKLSFNKMWQQVLKTVEGPF